MVIIDCSKINDFEEFIHIFNTMLINPLGGHWNGNLDAFNDFLSWPEDKYKLVLLGSSRCKEVLNYQQSNHHESSLWTLLQEILNDNQTWVDVEFR